MDSPFRPNAVARGKWGDRDFFISHNHSDNQWAAWVAYKLEEAGFKVIIDTWDFQASRSFITQMDEALLSGAHLLAVLSPEYMQSDYCRDEWQVARTLQRRHERETLCCVRVADFVVEGILGLYPCADLIGIDEPEAIGRLVRLVKGGRGKPDASPAFPASLTERAALPPTHRPRPPYPGLLSRPHLPPNKDLTARDPEIAALEAAVARHREADAPWAIVLCGQGGTGKTQLAINHAHRLVGRFQPIFFVNAEDAGALRAGIAGLASKTQLGLSQAEELDPANQYRAALEWLRSQGDWLLVLENVDNEAAADAVMKLLPFHPAGLTLITARWDLWRDGRFQRIALHCFTPDAGAAFLLARAGKDAGTEADARRLSEILGGLPLALEQAAACIHRLRWTFTRYTTDLLNGCPRLGPGDLHGETLYAMAAEATWRKQLPYLTEISRHLLHLCAFVGPDEIPRGLLTDPPPDSEIPEGDIENALGELAAHSLIELSSASLSIHRLIHAPLRNGLMPGEREVWLRRTLRQLTSYARLDARSFNFSAWPRWTPLMPHVRTALEAARRLDIDDPPFAFLADEAANFLWTHAEYLEAETIARVGLAAHTKHAGPAAEATGRAHGRLGRILRARGHFSAAEQSQRLALEVLRASLGPSEPRTVSALGDLADTIADQGRYGEAEPLFRQALDFHTSDPQTDAGVVASDLTGLAGVLRDLGQFAEAEPLLDRALEIRLRRHGQEHPSVARTYGNRSKLLRAMGRSDDSERDARMACHIHEQTLSRSHPDVARSFGHLAMALCDLKRLEEAEPLALRALDLRVERLGPDHAGVGTALSNLGMILHALGRTVDGEAHLNRAVEVYEQALGPTHPHVATASAKRGMLLRALGRSAEAEAVFRRAIDIHRQYPCSATLAVLIGCGIDVPPSGGPVAASSPGQ